MTSIAERRVLLTRSEEDNEPWARGLAERGAVPISLPCLTCEYLEGRDEALRRALGECEWVALCSRHAVRAVAALAPDTWPGGARIAVVGPITAVLAQDLLAPPDVVAPLGTAASLADELLERLGPGERVLLASAVEARPELEERLRAAGRSIHRLDLYRTVPVPAAPGEVVPEADAVFFASPSAVRAFAARSGGPPAASIVSLGPSTSAAVRALGWCVAAESDTRDLPGMIEAAVRAWSTEGNSCPNHE